MEQSFNTISFHKSYPATGLIVNLPAGNTCKGAGKDHPDNCNEHPVVFNTMPDNFINHPAGSRPCLNDCSNHLFACGILVNTGSTNPFACIDLPVSCSDRPVTCTTGPSAGIDLPSAGTDHPFSCNEFSLKSLIHFISKFQLITLKLQEDEHKTKNQAEHVPGIKKFC